jgi:hypothetical protein
MGKIQEEAGRVVAFTAVANMFVVLLLLLMVLTIVVLIQLDHHLT